MGTADECVRCADCIYFRHGDPREGIYDHCVNDAWFSKHKGEWFHIVDRKLGSCKYGVEKEEK